MSEKSAKIGTLILRKKVKKFRQNHNSNLIKHCQKIRQNFTFNFMKKHMSEKSAKSTPFAKKKKIVRITVKITKLISRKMSGKNPVK